MFLLLSVEAGYIWYSHEVALNEREDFPQTKLLVGRKPSMVELRSKCVCFQPCLVSFLSFCLCLCAICLTTHRLSSDECAFSFQITVFLSDHSC